MSEEKNKNKDQKPLEEESSKKKEKKLSDEKKPEQDSLNLNEEKENKKDKKIKGEKKQDSLEFTEGKEKKKDKKHKKHKDKDKKKESKKHEEEQEQKNKKPKLDKDFYEEELKRLQVELVKLHEWVKSQQLKVVIIFEGRDAAGKGGTIKRITQELNPRICRVVALGVPTEKEKTQWYFQRYVPHLPAAGEMVIFDRSWYNRGGVEHVMGFCTNEEYVEFLNSCPIFEEMLIHSGIILIKYWFSVSDNEQEKRFKDRLSDITKRWKFSPMDVYARSKWGEYSKAKDEMFKYTDTKISPWNVVNADDKKRAHLNCISHLLSKIKYKEVEHEKIELPPLGNETGYVRPPMEYQNFIPEIY